MIPLLVGERSSRVVHKIFAGDRRLHVWWTTDVECVSTLSRLEREKVDPSTIRTALGRLASLRAGWSEILPGTAVRETAKRLLRVHPLRAADSLQLAAAVVLADGDPSSVTFISLDDRLRDAAQREGFSLLPN